MHPLLAAEHARLRREDLASEAARMRRLPPSGPVLAGMRQSMGLGLVRAGMRLLVRMPDADPAARPAHLVG